MSRYIDADNLVERLKVSPIFQDFGTDGYFIRDMVIDLVGCRPTADVVPKSEVEKIFEEIETIIDNNTYKSYLPNSSLWSKGYKINQIIVGVAELKKKYTEEV